MLRIDWKDGHIPSDFSDDYLELVRLLTEGAGLEHSLMAAYLYDQLEEWGPDHPLTLQMQKVLVGSSLLGRIHIPALPPSRPGKPAGADLHT
jgi:hypothetical protein